MVKPRTVVTLLCHTRDERVLEATLIRGREAVIAVVDATEVELFVWWVNIGERPQPSASRLCGAWIFPKDERAAITVEQLTYGRIALPTLAATSLLLDESEPQQRILDPEATRGAVLSELSRLQTAFEDEQATRPKARKLRPPNWPRISDRIDVERPPAWDLRHPSGVGGPRALAIAYWIENLCVRWEELEEQRLSRSWLARLDGTVERTLPVVLVA